ncbi:hypothetical protein NDI45_17690 [Leptolyngbya sp. GB1-A1]|uniref:hypothetical protein n=1 Tax=Leptolyngbya sp. GB1-A1 TaxID=2933908 RepID=UPI00329A39D0
MRSIFPPTNRYIGGTRTQNYSLPVKQSIAHLIPASSSNAALLADWYRVDRPTVAHGNIPRRYGWALLGDASANLPNAFAS